MNSTEILLFTRELTTEKNEIYELEYYITVDYLCFGNDLLLENYGLMVCKENQGKGVSAECSSVRSLTTNYDKIEKLAKILHENEVTPVTLKDIVDDVLAA